MADQPHTEGPPRKRALMPLAPGSEDLELVVLADVLTRAGVEVLRVAPSLEPVALQHGTRIVPDLTLEQARELPFDVLAIPGGERGASALDADPSLAHLLTRCRNEGLIAAAFGGTASSPGKCPSPLTRRRSASRPRTGASPWEHSGARTWWNTVDHGMSDLHVR